MSLPLTASVAVITLFRFGAEESGEKAELEQIKISVYVYHMYYIPRTLANVLREATRHFPAVVPEPLCALGIQG
jgi:hypothetical protein